MMPRPRTGRGRREPLPPRLPQESARPRRPPNHKYAHDFDTDRVVDYSARGAWKSFFRLEIPTNPGWPSDGQEEEDTFLDVPIHGRGPSLKGKGTSEALPAARTSHNNKNGTRYPSRSLGVPLRLASAARQQERHQVP